MDRRNMMPIPTPADQNSLCHSHALGNGGVRPAVKLIRSLEHKISVVMTEKLPAPGGADSRRCQVPRSKGDDNKYCHLSSTHYPHRTHNHRADVAERHR
jgi:hypothetical protein